MPFTARIEGGVLVIAGVINETAVIGDVANALAPLVVDLGGVTSINSLGVARYLDFIATWRRRSVVYRNCSTPMVDAFLMLPALLGPEENTATIESFAVSFDCAKCSRSQVMMVASHEVHWSSSEPALPRRVCPACAGPLAPAREAGDYLPLFDLGAIKLKPPHGQDARKPG